MSIQTTEYPVMSEREATQLTEKIRITAHNYADARQKLTEYVATAKAGSAHIALDYASWTAYLSEVLGEEPMRLARGERQEMVSLLSAEGMSTRAIAPIVGSTHATVQQDIKAAGRNLPPEPDESVDTETGEIIEPPATTGLDGKQYPRPVVRNDPKPEQETPEPPKPRAEPVATQFTAAIVELNRIMSRLNRISENPNFTKNKNQIATLHGSDLARTISELETLAESLN